MENKEIQTAGDKTLSTNNPVYTPWLTNSEKAISQIMALSVHDAIKSQNPVIANIALVLPGAAKKILSYMIADVTGFLNVGKTMDAAQILTTADLIIRDLNFKNLKPDDFKVCFDNAKKGYYGKSYDRIDGMVICEWLSAYVAEKSTLIEDISFNEHEKIKKTGNVIAPEVVTFYKERLSEAEKTAEKKITTGVRIENIDGKDKYIVNQIPEKEYKELQKEPVKHAAKSPRDVFIQKCFSEFDDLCARSPSLDKNGQEIPGKYTDMEITDTIRYDFNKEKPITKTHVRPIDVTEYTQIKLTEYDTHPLTLPK